jgi:hypothetical protein
MSFQNYSQKYVRKYNIFKISAVLQSLMDTKSKRINLTLDASQRKNTTQHLIILKGQPT